MGKPTEDEKRVKEWAAENKISVDCVRLLIKDGFSSMEALTLLENEDIPPKIPRGQIPFGPPKGEKVVNATGPTVDGYRQT